MFIINVTISWITSQSCSFFVHTIWWWVHSENTTVLPLQVAEDLRLYIKSPLSRSWSVKLESQLVQFSISHGVVQTWHRNIQDMYLTQWKGHFLNLCHMLFRLCWHNVYYGSHCHSWMVFVQCAAASPDNVYIGLHNGYCHKSFSGWWPLMYNICAICNEIDIPPVYVFAHALSRLFLISMELQPSVF